MSLLQDQEFERVGSSQPIRVDVRVIAATNRDLAAAVEQGRFRADLFYRLNVFPLDVPPLRKRKADLPLILYFYLDRFSKEMGKQFQGVSPESMDKLMAYSWPGNVRELRNVVERAVILAKGPTLTFEDMAAVPSAEPGQAAMSGTLEELERGYISRTLEKTGWVIDGPRGAALILGLNPNTLRTRMKKLGIRRPGSKG